MEDSLKKAAEEKSKDSKKPQATPTNTQPGKQTTIKVKVTNSMSQKHVVWLGGSSFSSNDNFKTTVHTREQYQEMVPSCCRFNPVFSF